MSPTKDSSQTTTARGDAHEKVEGKKDGGLAATEGLKGEEALDKAIGDVGGEDPEITSAGDDPLEEAEAKKEVKH